MMTTFREDSNHERLIEDYLFSGYRQEVYKPSRDHGQQFARPIEDEDIFSIELNKNADAQEGTDDRTSLNNLDSYHDDSDSLTEQLDNLQSHRSSSGIDTLTSSNPEKSRDHAVIDLNKLSGDEGAIDTLDPGSNPPNEDNAVQDPLHRGSTQVASSKQLSRAEQMKQKIREQAQSLGLVPKKLGFDCDKTGMIDIDVDHPPVAKSKGRIIYEKLMQKSLELKKGPYGGRKLTWPIYREVLCKKICSDKRKIWDSFQKPTDDFDDEEEMITSTRNLPKDHANDSDVESTPVSPVDESSDMSNEPAEISDDSNDF